MGLIKAALVLAIAVFVTNFLNKEKERFSKVPYLGKLIEMKNFYLYSIIIVMTLILFLL